eukprot:4658603-Amphidinium_carterae.1
MGCFNPAVAIAIDVSSPLQGVKYCFLYTLAELVGACLAAAFFVVCRPEELEPDDDRPICAPGLFAKLTSEFLGTYMLVLTIGLTILSKSPAAALAVAAALLSMTFALGSVSGGHFNPAVTTAVYAAGHTDMDAGNWGSYVLAQAGGGCVAGITYPFLMGGETIALKLSSSSHSASQICMAECVFTVMLAFVYLSVATVKTPLTDLYGFAVAMAFLSGAVAVGPISGTHTHTRNYV